MGRSRQAQTRLISTLSLLFEMTEGEERQLAEEINEARVAAWRAEMAQLAAQYTTNPIEGPRGEEAARLLRQSRQDAASIRQTYNQQVRRRIEELYNANPRGNRNYYISSLEAWIQERDDYKARQIALSTEQTGARQAFEDFVIKNDLRGGAYTYDGPPPVGPICRRRFAEVARRGGTVTYTYVVSEPTPAHPNCPHKWRMIRPPALPRGVSAAQVWTG